MESLRLLPSIKTSHADVVVGGGVFIVVGGGGASL